LKKRVIESCGTCAEHSSSPPRVAAEAHGGLALVGRRVVIGEPAPASVGTVNI